ncbi:MAG: NAD(P)H-binding protein [Chitinophagaceae bacterium]|nr:NAD(P)H-binding protein [Chitinophagaceae bacterium]
MNTEIVIIGASGFIGQHLLNKALADESIHLVTILVRKELPIQNPKLKQVVVDFSNRDQVSTAIPHQTPICCSIGTTMKNVKGNLEAYRKVDFDIPLLTAEIGAAKDTSAFILVSAVGANAQSGNFYSKLKGETEQALKAVQLKSFHILQPSLLMGNRAEKRTGERIAQLIMPLISFLLPDRYKPIQGSDVAACMLQLAKYPTNGVHYHLHKEILNLSKVG